MTNVEVRIRSSYQTLRGSEQKAADYFLKHQQDIFSLPIDELAKRSGVSPTAWVRLCKAIGYDGLKDLRRQLYDDKGDDKTADPANDVYFADLREGSTPEQIIHTVTTTSEQALRNTSRLLDPAALKDAAKAILSADSIRLFGMGASALVAEDLYNKLLRINKNAIFSRDSHIQLSYSSTLTKKSAAVFISNTGSTEEVLQALEEAKKRGCHTIGITRYAKSPLSEGCDILLYTSSPEAYIRSGAMSSRLSQLLAVDVLFTVLATQDYKEIKQPLESSYKICLTHRVNS